MFDNNMSSFIVSNKLINRIVTKLYVNKDNDLSWNFRRLAEILTADHYTLTEEMIGQALHKMNCEAVGARYGKYDDMISEVYKYTPEYNNSLVQVYKDIECLSYQCAEGDVPDTELYKWLSEFESSIASRIIDQLPEYQTASWS